MEEPLHTSNRFAGLLIILFILLVSGAYYFYRHFPKTPVAHPVVVAEKPDFSVTQYKKTVPPGLPLDVVQEKNVIVVDSFSDTDTTGIHQDTFKYISKNDLKTNTALYKSYLSKNNWLLLESITTNPGVVVLRSKKDIQTLTITISFNSIQKQTSVDISLTYQPSATQIIKKK